MSIAAVFGSLPENKKTTAFSVGQTRETLWLSFLFRRRITPAVIKCPAGAQRCSQMSFIAVLSSPSMTILAKAGIQIRSIPIGAR